MADDRSPDAPPSEPRLSRRRRGEEPPPAQREPPHNIELEKAVLAALLDGRQAAAMHIMRGAGIDHPLFFFERDHRIVYLACLELDDQGARVEAQAVAELLSRYRFGAVVDKLREQQALLAAQQLDGLDRRKLREMLRRGNADEAGNYEDSALAAIGGFNAVTDLLQAFGPVSSLARNASLLKDYHLKRQLIGRLQGLVEQAFRTPEPFSDLVDAASKEVIHLRNGLATNEVHGMTTSVSQTLERIEWSRTHQDEGVKTGIDELDRSLMALRPGGLYVLAARPGVGKTSFALKILSNIAGQAEHPRRVLFVSLEVDHVDLLKKLLSAEAAIPFEKLERGHLLQEHDWATLAETAQRIEKWPVDLLDVSDLTVHGLRSIVQHCQLKAQAGEGGETQEANGVDGQERPRDHGLALVVIDYLQLLRESRSDMTEYEKISQITRILKNLARELHLPVLALSQMSRDSEKGASAIPRAPKLSDLRGSGSIEQDADAVLFLHRTDHNQEDEGPDAARRIEVVLAKNRFGPQAKVHMNFFPAKMRFAPAAREDRQQEEDTVAGGWTTKRERLRKKPGADEDLFNPMEGPEGG